MSNLVIKYLGLVCLSLGLSACGGGGGSSSGPANPPRDGGGGGGTPPLTIQIGISGNQQGNERGIVNYEAVVNSNRAPTSALTYRWQEVGSDLLNLQNSDTNTLQVTLPSVESDTTVNLQLTVSSEELQSAVSTSITLSILDVPPASIPPIVSAGEDQSVFENSIISLEGVANDPDGSIVSYHWKQVSGPAVVLSRTDTALVSASVLDVEAPGPAELEFELTVTDDSGESANDTVLVVVNNRYSYGELIDSDSDLKNRVYEGADEGTYTGLTVAATGDEAGFNIRYFLEEDAKGFFTIDEQSGKLTVTDKLAVETKGFVDVTVRAESDHLEPILQKFKVSVSSNEEPLVEIDFPLNNSHVFQSEISVRGRVNHVDLASATVTITSGVNTYQTNVLENGEFNIDNVVLDSDGKTAQFAIDTKAGLDAELTQNYTLYTTPLISKAVGSIWDASKNRMLVMDDHQDAVFEIDLTDGSQRVLVKADVDMSYVVAADFDLKNNVVYYINSISVNKMDLNTGKTSLVSDHVVGEGSQFNVLRSISGDYDNGRILVLDHIHQSEQIVNRLFSVDIGTGNRVLVSGDGEGGESVGLGDEFKNVQYVEVDSESNVAYVFDQGGIYSTDRVNVVFRVDIDSSSALFGNREVVSRANYSRSSGTGIPSEVFLNRVSNELVLFEQSVNGYYAVINLENNSRRNYILDQSSNRRFDGNDSAILDASGSRVIFAGTSYGGILEFTLGELDVIAVSDLPNGEESGHGKNFSTAYVPEEGYYLLSEGWDDFWVIDKEGLSRTRIEASYDPAVTRTLENMVVHPNGESVFGLNSYGDALFELSLQDFSLNAVSSDLLGVGDPLEDASRVVITESGESAYLLDHMLGQVIEVDLNSGDRHLLISDISQDGDLYIGDQGMSINGNSLFVSDWGASTLYKIDLESETTEEISLSGLNTGFRVWTMDHLNSRFYGVSYEGDVYAYSLQTGELEMVFRIDAGHIGFFGSWAVEDLQWDAESELLIATYWKKVVVIDPESGARAIISQ